MQDEEYRKHAALEDDHWFFRSLRAHMTRELRETLRSGRPVHILDAGCGTGGLLKKLILARPEWSYTGVDISPLACQYSRERTGAEIIEASVEQLPIEDGCIDAVLSADVLCQVENPQKAASEFFRVLRPGGVAIINLPAHKWLWSYHDEHCGNRCRYKRAEIRSLLAGAGFRGIQVRAWNTVAFPGIVIRRKLLSPRPGSDVEAPSRPVQYIMRALCAMELAWLDLGLGLPFGSSWLTVARKPLAGEMI
jgi:SAM-dependent methyltransferase